DARVDARAKKHAQSLFAQLGKDHTLAALAKAGSLPLQDQKAATRQQPGVNQALLKKVFALPHPTAKKPSNALVSLGGGSFALVALNGVHAGDPSKIPALQRKMLLSQMRQAYSATVTNEWLKLVK